MAVMEGWEERGAGKRPLGRWDLGSICHAPLPRLPKHPEWDFLPHPRASPQLKAKPSRPPSSQCMLGRAAPPCHWLLSAVPAGDTVQKRVTCLFEVLRRLVTRFSPLLCLGTDPMVLWSFRRGV